MRFATPAEATGGCVGQRFGALGICERFWEVLGGPWSGFGRSLGVLGGSLGVLGGPWEVLGVA